MSSSFRAVRGCLLRLEAIASSQRYWGKPTLFLIAACAVTAGWHYGVEPLENKLEAKGDYLLAEMEAARGHDLEASNDIRMALTHTRTDASMWRLAATLSQRLNSSEAAYCWRQVDWLAPGDLWTQLSCVEAATQARQLDLAAAVLNEVAEPDRPKNAFLIAAASLAEARGETAEAGRNFDLLEAKHPTEPRTRLALAEWHARSTDPSTLRKSRAELSLLLAKPGLQESALRTLIVASINLGERQEALAWSDRLLHSGQAIWEDRIQRLDLEDGTTLEVSLSDLMKGANAEEMPALVKWMVAHARAEQALIWIREQPEAVQNDPQVGAARAECLGALGLWEHLRDIQQDDSWPQRESARLMYLTRARIHLADMAGAQAAWGRSVLACRGYADFLELLDAADAAAKAPLTSAFWPDAKTQVFNQMATAYPDQEWITRALLQDALRRHDSLRARESWARLAALNANNVEAAAQWHLLSLLRHEQMSQSSSALAALRRDHPADDHVLVAVAYAFFRQGQRQEAMEALGELSPDRLTAPENAALIAPILAAEGMKDEAQTRVVEAQAQPDLLPEERELVEEAKAILMYRAELQDIYSQHAGLDSGTRAVLQNSDAGHQDVLLAVARSVRSSLAGKGEEAMESLAQIDVTKLEAVEGSIYLGGVLHLAGEVESARPYLNLESDLPYQTALALNQHAVEAWWKICARTGNQFAALRGLFAAYAGLEEAGAPPGFWYQDKGREILLLRSVLLRGQDIEGARSRLESLLRHVPFTPETQALRAFALARSGQPRAAELCLEELLSSDDLRRPEPALFYGMALASDGRQAEALPYLKLALASNLPAEEKALAIQTVNVP